MKTNDIVYVPTFEGIEEYTAQYAVDTYMKDAFWLDNYFEGCKMTNKYRVYQRNVEVVFETYEEAEARWETLYNEWRQETKDTILIWNSYEEALAYVTDCQAADLMRVMGEMLKAMLVAQLNRKG